MVQVERPVEAAIQPEVHVVQVEAPLPLYLATAQELHTEATEAPTVELAVPAAHEVLTELAEDVL